MPYNVYVSPWNGSKQDIDYSMPFYAGASPIIFTGLRGGSDGYVWVIVRNEINSIEEKNFNFLKLTWINNDLSINYPSTPYQLWGIQLDQQKLRLSWQFELNHMIVPDGFYIYGGDNTVDYSSTLATTIYPVNEITISNSIMNNQFTVLAYHGINLGSASEVLSIVPESSPVDITYTTQTTWRNV